MTTTTAQMFELDNVRRFRKFWDTCTAQEQNEIYKWLKVEMGDALENTQSKKQLDAQAIAVIHFLNEKTGKKFRPVETHLKHIRARLKSGISTQELKAIIALKTREWRGTDQEQFLRPATLFNETNCENYLGQLS